MHWINTLINAALGIALGIALAALLKQMREKRVIDRKLEVIRIQLRDKPIYVACPLDKDFAEEVVRALCEFGAAALYEAGYAKDEHTISFDFDFGAYYAIIIGLPKDFPEVAVQIFKTDASGTGTLTCKCRATPHSVVGVVGGFMDLEAKGQ